MPSWWNAKRARPNGAPRRRWTRDCWDDYRVDFRPPSRAVTSRSQSLREPEHPTPRPPAFSSGRVKGRRPRAIGRFSLLFRGAVLRPGGAAVDRQGASPWDTRVMPSPEAPEGRPRLARGRPTLGEAGLAGVFAGRPGARSPLSGLRRLAMSPTQRLAPLAINCCPSGARRDSRTPTSWNENGKRRLAPNGQPFTAPLFVPSDDRLADQETQEPIPAANPTTLDPTVRGPHGDVVDLLPFPRPPPERSPPEPAMFRREEFVAVGFRPVLEDVLGAGRNARP